jgi:hypothetical protein
MGREGRGPVEQITSIPGEPGDFGDGATYMQQPVVAPSRAAATKRASAELSRSTAMGGFGVTEETHSNLRTRAKGESPPGANETTSKQ